MINEPLMVNTYRCGCRWNNGPVFCDYFKNQDYDKCIEFEDVGENYEV